MMPVSKHQKFEIGDRLFHLDIEELQKYLFPPKVRHDDEDEDEDDEEDKSD